MFFANCTTAQEIKDEFKRLVLIHHPDVGGDEETMKRLNTAYQDALKNCRRSGSTYTDDKTGQTVERPYIYADELEEKLAEMVTALLLLAQANGHKITVSLLGTWIWVEGDTRPLKDALKALGLSWNKVRECWCYNGTGKRCRRSSQSLEGLKRQYNARPVVSKGDLVAV